MSGAPVKTAPVNEARTPQSQAVLAATAAYAAERQAAVAQLTTVVLAAWVGVNAQNVLASWSKGGIGQRVYVLISMLQQLLAQDANAYTRRVLALQGLKYTGPAINAPNFAGIASDGRDLETLLAGAPIQMLEGQRGGLSDAQARDRGANFLRLVITTQIADAGRAAVGVSLTAADPVRPAGPGQPEKKVVLGWIRVLNPPSCSRCVALAGKWFRWDAGFERHPNCFPAGTVVSGPSFEAATRRWFEGELVTIRTASGQELTVTGNHPVLTDRGWVPATLIQKGDHVIRSLGAHSALGEIPDDQQIPALVEDVFDALSMVGALRQVPGASEDFHGDGTMGQVDVVAPDRHLRLEEFASFVQPLPELAFTGRPEHAALHTPPGGEMQRFLVSDAATHGFVSSGGLGRPFLGRHLRRTHETCRRMTADLDAALEQAIADGAPVDVVLLAERVLALARLVLGGDLGGGQDQIPARWDAPAGPLSRKTRAGYAGRGQDLLVRLAGQVTRDCVVEKVGRQWSGHVFNLTSSEGWLVADGIIASNCDCDQVPADEPTGNDVTTNPYLYFQSLTPAEQDRYFGKSQAQAIRDGADINQVINATTRPGVMFTADDGKRYTREGTSKRGLSYQRAGKVLRPTPAQIYQDANGDIDTARRELKRFGYIL